MPKKTWNIKSFAKGMNFKNTSKDIEPEGFEFSNNYISFSEGSISTEGLFDNVPGLSHDVGCFQENLSFQGTSNLYKVFPEMGFRRFGRAQYASSGTKWKEEGSTNDDFTVAHGLDVGLKIVIISSGDHIVSDSGSRNASLISTTGVVSNVIDYNEFQIAELGVTPDDGDEIFYAIFSDYDTDLYLNSNPSVSMNENKFLFRGSQGKFGIYNIGQYKGWFGRTIDSNVNAFGNDSWFFDSRYLWDTQQHSRYGLESEISSTLINDAFYEGNVFRLSLESPNQYYGGRCKRPVGLYGIDRRQHRFSEGESVIFKGWYPLRSHCLAPHEYHRLDDLTTEDTSGNTDSSNDLTFYKGGGTIAVDANAGTTDLLATAAGDPTGPAGYNYPASGPLVNQVAMSIAHGEGTSLDAPGDWQFTTGSVHEKLKFGISFIYDTIQDEFGLESSISPITNTDGSDGWVSMSGDSPTVDKALILWYSFYRGENNFIDNQNMMFADSLESGVASPAVSSIGEFRGSGMNNGYSNSKCWNPRIVGARIYLMGDLSGKDADGYNEFQEPLFLAKIDFGANKYGQSHDNIQSSAWTNNSNNATGVWGQQIVIPGVPVLTYKLMNGYDYDDSIHSWYKTSAIVNRKLYAGNVSYFDTTEVDWEKRKPVNKPDRILVSPTNKFDILPSKNYLDVMIGDGQDIVKLQAFNSELLVYKNDDMFIINCEGEYEILGSTNYNMGVSDSMKVTKTPNAIYWINESGVWGYDGENAISNIIQETMDSQQWSKEIYSESSFIEYEPKLSMLFIFTRYQGENYSSSMNPSNILCISTTNGSIFFKGELAINNLNAIPSGCIVADNSLYTAVSSGVNANQGLLNVSNVTSHAIPVRQSGIWEFTLDIAGANDYQFVGNEYKRLIVRYRSSEVSEADNWDAVNSNDFAVPNISDPSVTTIEEIQNLINIQLDHFNTSVNNSVSTDTHPLGSTPEYADIYEWNLDASIVDNGLGGWLVTYYLYLTAKVLGATNNLTDTGSGAALLAANATNSVWGDTAVAFSSTSDPANCRVSAANTSSFQQIQHIDGADVTNGVWNIFINRNNSTHTGEAFALRARLNDTDTATSEIDETSFYYTTSADGSGNDAVNSTRATTGFRDALASDEFWSTYFTIGAITTGDQTAVTGLAAVGSDHYQYFTITAKGDSFPTSNFELTFIESSDTGGKLYKFNPQAKHQTQNQLITKTIDFGQPGVRKKVYKAYVSYKTGAVPADNITVEYMINGNGTWNTAVLKNGNNETVSIVPASTEWSRFTIEENTTTRTNSIYSIQYKINGSSYVEIDDMSIIYREKPAR